MKKQTMINKLEKCGYKVTFTMQGNVIATKGQKSYNAATLTELYRIIF